MKDRIEFEKISVDDARKSIERITHPETIKDWTGLRKATPVEPLREPTRQWMASMPYEARPRELVRQFPRIANKLCDLWKRPAQCEPYLRQLILDDRVGRKGFPAAVSNELLALAGHYRILYPYRRTVWDDVLKGR